MANLNLEALVFSATLLGSRFGVAECAFGGKPRGEEARRVELLLEITDYLGGGDVGWFVNCKDAFDYFELGFRHDVSVHVCRKGHEMVVISLEMHGKFSIDP